MSRALVDDADVALAAAQELLATEERRLRERTSISGWNAAQHLEHISIAAQLSLNAVLGIAAGRGEPREGKAEVMARRILRSGAIPAGAQAPDPALPSDAGDLGRATACLGECRGWLQELDPAGLGTGTVPHPFLGPFTAEEWLRFVAVHTRHHLDIIGRILEAAPEPPNRG